MRANHKYTGCHNCPNSVLDASVNYDTDGREWVNSWECNNCGWWMPRRENKRGTHRTPSQFKAAQDITACIGQHYPEACIFEANMDDFGNYLVYVTTDPNCVFLTRMRRFVVGRRGGTWYVNSHEKKVTIKSWNAWLAMWD